MRIKSEGLEQCPGLGSVRSGTSQSALPQPASFSPALATLLTLDVAVLVVFESKY
jgi:hypothetical protein